MSLVQTSRLTIIPRGTDVVTETKVRESVIEVEDRYLSYDDEVEKNLNPPIILSVRERERRELQDLNDRLARFLEKVHRLEGENKNLEAIKVQWEKNLQSIGSIYQKEVNETQRNLEDSAKIRATLEGQVYRMQSELANLRQQFDDAVRANDGNVNRFYAILKQLSDAEAELNLLRRRCEFLEAEVARLKKEHGRLHGELQQTKADIAQQTQKCAEYQSHVQALLQKIEHLRRTYQQEVAELRKQTTTVDRDQYKSDLDAALIEIRRDFAALNDKRKAELHAWYSRKIQEYQVTETSPYLEEHKRLAAEIELVRVRMDEYENRNALLRKEIQSIQFALESEKSKYESILLYSEERIRKHTDRNRSLKEKLDVLFQTNRNLQAEIDVYRKLLDGEGVLRNQMVKVQEKEKEEMHIVKEEQVAHTKYERTHKGNVQFYEISKEGKFIILQNTSFGKDEDIGGFTLVRKLDNNRESSFVFPPHFVLKPGQTVKIWANNQGGTHDPPDSLVCRNINSWGVGQTVATSLYNREGEEKASYNQFTVTSHRTL